MIFMKNPQNVNQLSFRKSWYPTVCLFTSCVYPLIRHLWLNKSSSLAGHLGVTKFIIIDTIFWTQFEVEGWFSFLCSRVTCCQCYKTFYNRKLRLFIISKSTCPW